MEIDEYKNKAIKGTAWSVIEKFSLQIIQFIVGIILARLLEPSDFGLIALTTIFISISGAIIDGGFEKALIQKKELSELQINSSFYINIGLGILLAILICFFSPYIAQLFNEPKLKLVISILALGIPIDALGQTQRTMLMKNLEFKKISYVQIISSIVSALTGISLALYGYGVWALVISSIVSTFIRVVFFWIKSSWYPKLQFSYSAIADIVPFGVNVMASSILYFTVQQFNNFIVGKYYTKTELGLFNRGSKLPEFITSTIQSIALKMALPLFSKLQDSRIQMIKLLEKANQMVAFIEFPLLTILFLDAKEIITLLLTEKWLGATIFLKMFCIIKLFEPLISIQRELLLARGKAKLLFKLFIITSIIEIVPTLLLVQKGIMIVIWISLIAKLFQYFIYQFVISKEIDWPIYTSIRQFVIYFIICVAVIVLVQSFNYALSNFFFTNLFIKIVIDFSFAFICYLLISLKYKPQELATIKTISSALVNGNLSKKFS